MKKKRNLSGIYFRSKNEETGKFDNIVFEDLSDEEQRKIIGYKAPYDMAWGGVKKGDLGVKSLIQPFYRVGVAAMLPEEFVEKDFIPVYEEEKLEIKDWQFSSGGKYTFITIKGKLTQEHIDKIKEVIK